MVNDRSIVVIGGGLAGLTAAHRLQQAGCRVTVLERSESVGGRVQTERSGGYLVDTGPDALTASYARYLSLVRELGLEARVTTPSQVVGLVRAGRIIDVDPARPWQLPRSPILSIRAKLRLARGLVTMRRTLKGIDTYDLAASAELDDPGTNAHDYALRHFGREATERLIDPVIRLVTGSGASEASPLAILGALRSWSVPLVNLTGGLDGVPAALAERLDVRLGCTALAVDGCGDGVAIRYEDADSRAAELRADACVIASMYGEARELWPALDGLAPDFGAELRDVKLVSVSLGFRVRARSRAYAVLVPTVENADALLIFFQHNKASDRAPAGHSLITIYTDTLATDRFLARDDAEVVKWAAGVIESLCPELRGHRELATVTRWPRAGYLAAPGFWRRASALRQAIPANGRIQLAGDLFGAGSMESAVASGERAAQRLADTVLADDVPRPAIAINS